MSGFTPQQMGAVSFALLALGFFTWALCSGIGRKQSVAADRLPMIGEAPESDGPLIKQVSFSQTDSNRGEPTAGKPSRPCGEAERETDAPGKPVPAEVDNLLREGRFDEVLAWLKKSEQPRAGAEALRWLVVEARALAGQSEWAQARERFVKAAEAGDESHPERIEASLGAPVDGAFGELWCKAKGAPEKIPTEALKEIADCPYDSWGRAMAQLYYAERCMTLFPKGTCLIESLPYLQKALLSNRLDESADARCAECFRSAVDQTLLDSSFQPSELVKPIFHEVAAGESIFRIAKQYGVDPGQIVRLNKLDANLALFVGKKLKLIPGTVTVKVDRARLCAYLCFDGVVLRRYPVCIGPGEKTPSGTFTIRTKVANPEWWWNGKKYPYGSPENILGTRWLGFDGEENGGKGAGIGLHGTTKPESIPGRESLGCVRFLNADIEEVYAFLPIGGTAEISK